MEKTDEGYVERLCNAVVKTITEIIENLTIEDVNMYQLGYKKAIDDFAEKLVTDVESFQADVNGIKADLMTLDYFAEYVWDVAEQMQKE